MSSNETQGAPVESRSSVKIATNAKGDAQVEVKVYSGNEDSVEMILLRDAAVSTYLETKRALAASGEVSLA